MPRSLRSPADGDPTKDSSTRRNTDDSSAADLFHPNGANALLDSLFTSSTDGLFIKDGDLIYRRVNPAMTPLLGQPAAEIVGRSDEDLFEAPTAALMRAQDLRVLAGQTIAADQVIASPNGDRLFHVIKTPMRNDVGRVIGVHGVARETTDQKESDTALRLSEQRYRTLVTTTASVVWTTDAEGGFTTPQSTWKAYTDQPWPEHAGWGWTKMLHPEDRNRIQETWREAVANPRVIQLEGRLWRAATGRHRYFVVQATPVFDDHGAVREWIGAINDIDDRRRAELALIEVAKSVTPRNEGQLLHSLVKQLAYALDADYVFIGEQTDMNADRIRSLAIFGEDQILQNFEYDLADTPCEGVVGKRLCCHPRDVRQLFPRDLMLHVMKIDGYIGMPLFNVAGQTIGLMAVLYCKPIPDPAFASSMLSVFATRGQAELGRAHAERALRESQRTLSTLITNLPGMVYRCANEPSWPMAFVSEGCYDLTGYHSRELMDNHVSYGDDIIYPEDRDRVWQAVQEGVEGMRPFTMAYRILTRTGELRWVREQGVGVFDANRRLLSLEGFIANVTETRHMAALRDIQNNVLNLLTSGASLEEVLGALVVNIEKQTAGLIGSVLLLDESTQTIRHAAAPNLPETFIQAVNGLPIGPNVGSCGTAMHLNRLVVVDNIQTDPRWADYRELAQQHDLHACWSQPIVGADGRVIGAFALYYHQPCKPGDFELHLINTAAQLTALAIERKEQELKLRESKEHYRQVAESKRRLLDEVNHRVRNNLAELLTLLKLIHQQTSTKDEFADAMRRRLTAMVCTHNVLAESGWDTTDLGALLTRLVSSSMESSPHSIDVTLDGPEVHIEPRQAIALSMTVLELLSNSLKYGAHSKATGRLAVQWELDQHGDEQWVAINWRETGGPPIAAKPEPSLGSELLEGFVAFELGGYCELRYRPDGADHQFAIKLTSFDKPDIDVESPETSPIN